MSKFFGEESDSDSTSEEEVGLPKVNNKALFFDEEVPVKRVVKSGDQKWQDEFDACIIQLKNLIKIKDFCNLSDCFDNLVRIYSKKNLRSVPEKYLACLMDLQFMLHAAYDDKNIRNSLSKSAAKCLTVLRQKLRKYMKLFDHDISAYSANTSNAQFNEGVLLKEDEEEEVEDVSQNDIVESSDSGTSDELFECANPREYFLKKDKADVDVRRVRKSAKKRGLDDDAWKTVESGSSFPLEKKGVMFDTDEITVAMVAQKLNELSLLKTTKRSMKRQHLNSLYKVEGICEEHNLGKGIALKVKLDILKSIFAYNPNFVTPLKPEFWIKLKQTLASIFVILTSDDSILVSADVNVEQLEGAPYKINGCIVTLIESFLDEFEKNMKECDPYSMEYVDRIKDEECVMLMTEHALKYLKINGSVSDKCRIYLCKMMQMHYKLHSEVFNQENQNDDNVDVMKDLCSFICRFDISDVLRTQAILFQIYFLSIHDKWVQARDLMLMSRLQDNIDHSDVRTQILFNRAMAQLGVCAFRNGHINEAHGCLSELINTGRSKELLGQGFIAFRSIDRTREQEQRERQHLLPFHLHISLEVLECVYLICSMLIDIPYMAAHESDMRRRMISKAFYQQLRMSERQYLIGPPETMREHVIAASRAIRKGDWKSCRDFLINSKMEKKVWRMIRQPTSFLESLEFNIKKCALQTYIFTYGHLWESLSIAKVAILYEIPEEVVRHVIGEKITNGELNAKVDLSNNTILFLDYSRSYVHCLSHQLAEKLTILLESNERIFDRSRSKIGGDIIFGHRRLRPM